MTQTSASNTTEKEVTPIETTNWTTETYAKAASITIGISLLGYGAWWYFKRTHRHSEPVSSTDAVEATLQPEEQQQEEQQQEDRRTPPPPLQADNDPFVMSLVNPE